MNLLIVDDNRYVVEGLKRQIDWHAFGMENVFGCYNVPEAKRIISEQNVDFVFADIEMPGQNGFDLLEWIRQRDSEMEVVLLTSYTDFTYAQKAVAYKVSKYLLKPLDTEELEKVVRDLVQQHRVREKKKQLMEYGNQWISQQSTVKSLFWRSLLEDMRSGNRGEFRASNQTVLPPYEEKARIVLVLILFNTGAEVWQDETLCFMCNNALEEISEKSAHIFEAVYCVQPGRFLAVFRQGNEDPKEVQRLMRDFGEFIKVYFQFDVTFCFFNPVRPERLWEQLQEVFQICGDNCERDANQLIEPQEYPAKKLDYQSPDIQTWKRMIQMGNMERFLDSFCEFLQMYKEADLQSPEFVGLLLMDWNLLVSEILRENTAYQSISQLRSNQLRIWLTQDIQTMKQLILDEANRLFEEMNTVDDANALVTKIKNYIREHIDEVNRGQIADYFYLSPSYLSKLFRRETGESLIDYIQKERIDLAKELLLYSEYSISDIAIQTGYPNFSHFSKQFRKFVGCTPNEFRKNKKPK